MPIPSPDAFFTLFSGFVLLGGGCFAVVFLVLVVFFVRILTGMRRKGQENKALIAAGHTVTATITGVREEHTKLPVGKSPVLGTQTYQTITRYVFSAIWRDPRTGQDVTFTARAALRSRYAIGSPVTVYVNPNDYSRYVIR